MKFVAKDYVCEYVVNATTILVWEVSSIITITSLGDCSVSSRWLLGSYLLREQHSNAWKFFEWRNIKDKLFLHIRQFIFLFFHLPHMSERELVSFLKVLGKSFSHHPTNYNYSTCMKWEKEHRFSKSCSLGLLFTHIFLYLEKFSNEKLLRHKKKFTVFSAYSWSCFR